MRELAPGPGPGPAADGVEGAGVQGVEVQGGGEQGPRALHREATRARPQSASGLQDDAPVAVELPAGPGAQQAPLHVAVHQGLGSLEDPQELASPVQPRPAEEDLPGGQAPPRRATPHTPRPAGAAPALAPPPTRSWGRRVRSRAPWRPARATRECPARRGRPGGRTGSRVAPPRLDGARRSAGAWRDTPRGTRAWPARGTRAPPALAPATPPSTAPPTARPSPRRAPGPQSSHGSTRRGPPHRMRSPSAARRTRAHRSRLGAVLDTLGRA